MTETQEQPQSQSQALELEEKPLQQVTLELSRKGDAIMFDASHLPYGTRNHTVTEIHAIFGRITLNHDKYSSRIEYQLFPALLSLSKADEMGMSEKIHREAIPYEEEVPVTVNREMLDRKVKRRIEDALWSIRSQLKQGIPIDDDGEVIDHLPTDEIIRAVEKAMEEKALNFFTKKILKKKYTKTVRKERVSEKPIPVASFKFHEAGIEVVVREPLTLALIQNLLPVCEYRSERMRQLRAWRNAGCVPEEERNYEVRGPHEPYDHQWVMFKYHTMMDRTADLSQMGTGKTLGMLMAIDWRIQQGHVRKGHILVVGPKMVIEKWATKEIPLHLPHRNAKIISGSYGNRLNTVMGNSSLPEDERADIFLINYESFAMKKELPGKNGENVEIKLSQVLGLHSWDLVVLDEAHKIKNPNAQRTFSLIDAFEDVPYRHILTGTINANTMIDVHMPFVFLNRAAAFNTTQYKNERDDNGRMQQVPLSYTTLYDHFSNAYFYSSGYKRIPKSNAVTEIRSRFEEMGVRFEKHECITLPPKNYDVRVLEMSPLHKELYNALENKMITDLSDMRAGGGRVSMMNVLAMMVKLREAANGWIRNDEGENVKFPWNPKLDALIEIMDEIDEDEKVVVWGTFTHDLHEISRVLKERYGDEAVGVIHGAKCNICGSDPSRRTELVQDFLDKEKSPRIMVLNVDVGSHGIDLTSASYAIFFSNSFVKTNRVQGEDRTHRIGMQDHLTIIDLICKDTIDETVYNTLQSWQSMSSALLGHLGLDVKVDDAKDEEPAIAPQVQGPKECVLATLCMLAGRSIHAGRRFVVDRLGREQWAPHTNYDEHQVRDAWGLKFNDVTYEYVSSRSNHLTDLPDGRGMITIQYNGRNIRHRVAFINGFVYDPAPISGRPEDVKHKINDWIGMISSENAKVTRVLVQEDA